MKATTIPVWFVFTFPRGEKEWEFVQVCWTRKAANTDKRNHVRPGYRARIVRVEVPVPEVKS